ncbi:MAG: hypothetical protein AAFQ58_21280 [Pseudomonadota bacterium]
MKNMFAPRERSSGCAAEIKAWVSKHLELLEDDLVSVAELTCHEPDCPPVETVVTVHRNDGERETWKIHKPMSEVSQSDVSAWLPNAKAQF